MSDSPQSALSICRDGAVVNVFCDPGTGEWLRDRIRIYFDVREPAKGCDLWMIHDSRRNAPDGKWRPYQRAGSNGEYCRFLVDMDRRWLVVEHDDPSWRRIFILRMVRNIIRWELFSRGAVFLHASCVERDGIGVALAGGSRSGKSTTVSSLIESREWGYVTDDDLCVLPDPEGKLIASGWPGCLRMRRRMALNFPILRDSIGGFGHPANSLEGALPPDIGLVRVFPEELSRAYGCRQASAAELGLAIWLDWGNSIRATKIGKDRALDLFLSSWDILPERKPGVRPDPKGGSQQDWSRLVFDPFLLAAYGIPDLARHHALIERMAREIECVELTHAGLSTDLITRIKSLVGSTRASPSRVSKGGSALAPVRLFDVTSRLIGSTTIPPERVLMDGTTYRNKESSPSSG